MITKNDLILIKEALNPQFENIDKQFESVNKQFESVNKQLKSIKKDTKNLDAFDRHFDREHQKSRRRLDRIEDKLNLPPIE